LIGVPSLLAAADPGWPSRGSRGPGPRRGAGHGAGDGDRRGSATSYLLTAGLSAVLGLTLAGCGGNDQPDDTGRETFATTPGSTGRATVPPSDATAPRGEQMKVQITIGGQRFEATIFDSAAGPRLSSPTSTTKPSPPAM
jgi:hypothetical protein